MATREGPRGGIRALAGALGLTFALSACSSLDTPGAAGASDGEQSITVSAAEGAVARDMQSAALDADAKISSDLAIDCGIDEVYEPTPEEIASSNADVDGLAAAFEAAGVAYTRSEDELGFVALEWDYESPVAQEVSDTYWAERYPPQPLPSEEVARLKAENDAIVAALEEVGAEYTRHPDPSGAEWIEWDYANAVASDAVETVYAELYPPVPPSTEEVEAAKAENDKLAEAFDAAGIVYTRKADDAGWEWIEWDYEDEQVSLAVQAVFDELYPFDPTVDPCGAAHVDGSR